MDAVAVKDEDARNDGPQKGRHGDAGQDDADGHDAVFPGQEVNDGGCGHGADEGYRRHPEEISRPDDEDDDTGQAGAG